MMPSYGETHAGAAMNADEKPTDVLVVDEDDLTRRAAEIWFQREGHEAHCLPSGLAALRFLDAYRPKFSVLDVTTLGAEGLDVLAAIRHQPRLRDLPMVIHVAV